jgi:hypothetical protein
VTISADQFAYILDNVVKSRIDIVRQASEEDIEATSKDVVADLKESSPKLTGKYAKGWMYDMHHAADSSPYAVIHNKAKPGLTHLLEHGHGGPAPAKAHPHIEAAYERGAFELNEKMSGS